MMIHPRLKTLASGAWTPITCTALASLLIAATYVAQGFLSAYVIHAVMERMPFVEWRGQLFSILLLLVVRSLLVWLKSVSGLWTQARVKQRLRQRLYRKILLLGPVRAERIGSARIQSAVVDGVEAMEAYFATYLPQLVTTILVPAGLLIYVYTLHVWIGLVITIAIASAILTPKLWERLLGSYGSQHWQAYADLNAKFIDNIQGITTLKSFNLATRRGADLEQESHRLYRATMKQLAISMFNTAVLSLSIKVGSALVVALGAYLVVVDQLAFIHLLTLLFLAGECMRPLTDLDRYWHQGYLAISASEGILDVLQTQEIETPQTPYPEQLEAPVSITFDQVSFAYQDRDQEAVSQVSFQVQGGQTLAVVGPSGAGKSTLIQLLLRFVEPAEGEIRLNGILIQNLDPAALRQVFAVVQQDCHIFYGTVAENLRIAKPDATQAELEAAAKVANAHDFIAQLPEGYDTLIGERGANISGGERQRLAIARAVLKDAPVLVFDEATASVDASNEHKISDALQRIGQHKTVLIVAHRLSTVTLADQIIVLDQGRVIETGQPQDLITRASVFARFVQHQKGAA